jgi:hypothetical protein
MAIKSSPSDKKSSGGDVFSTFLNTVRGAADEGLESSPVVEKALLKLLKISGPQTLEKLRALCGSEAPNFIDTLYRLSEDNLIAIGTDPKFPPDETAVRITPQGLDWLTKS